MAEVASVDSLVHWLGGLAAGTIAYFLRWMHIRHEKHIEESEDARRTIEADIAVLQSQHNNLSAWLERVEEKLDRALETK